MFSGQILGIRRLHDQDGLAGMQVYGILGG